LRDELGVELDERDYARKPLSVAELKELFKGHDPRDFLNPKSPAFKAKGLAGKKLTQDQALELMVEDPNLIKRPLVIAGGEIIPGAERERLRELLGGS
jgi:arsenate reductase